MEDDKEVTTNTYNSCYSNLKAKIERMLPAFMAVGHTDLMIDTNPTCTCSFNGDLEFIRDNGHLQIKTLLRVKSCCRSNEINRRDFRLRCVNEGV